MWPIRTGTAVEGGHVYFAAALVPWRDSYLCSVDANEGTENYRVSGGSTPMGAILTSAAKVYLTQGKSFPSVYDRNDGRLLRNFESTGYGGGLTNAGNANGGVYALITSDPTPQFVYGRGQSYGADDHPTESTRLRAFNASTADSLATHPSAICMVVSDGTAFILTGTSLHAVTRPSGPTIWTTNTGFDYAPRTLIQAGNHLFVGGNAKVVAYDRSDGSEVWSQPVTGRARGLAAANGHLLVSTDTGHIYAFGGAADNLHRD